MALMMHDSDPNAAKHALYTLKVGSNSILCWARDITVLWSSATTVDTARDLGVIVDSQLTTLPHVLLLVPDVVSTSRPS